MSRQKLGLTVAAWRAVTGCGLGLRRLEVCGVPWLTNGHLLCRARGIAATRVPLLEERPSEVAANVTTWFDAHGQTCDLVASRKCRIKRVGVVLLDPDYVELVQQALGGATGTWTAKRWDDPVLVFADGEPLAAVMGRRSCTDISKCSAHKGFGGPPIASAGPPRISTGGSP